MVVTGWFGGDPHRRSVVHQIKDLHPRWRFPERVRWDTADLLEVQPPFDAGSRTFLGFGDALHSRRDALVWREDFPPRPGRTRQLDTAFWECRVWVEIIQKGQRTRGATQPVGRRVAELQHWVDDFGSKTRRRMFWLRDNPYSTSGSSQATPRILRSHFFTQALELPTSSAIFG